MGEFVHLHLHSEYSLLDGACRIKDIPLRAIECGHDAVAITDHGVMYGAISFYNECRAHNIKPIIGCEVYVAAGSRFEKNLGKNAERYNHLVLLCENMEGYKNLMYLVSKGFTEGFYSKPRIDIELLRAHSRGLIALSACLAGSVPSHLLKGDVQGAQRAALELEQIFGKGNFYIELQDHGLSAQHQILPGLVALAEDCDIPLVATNDCHYLRRENSQTQATLMCIQTNTTVLDGRPTGFETDEFYYKTTAEMKMLFGRYKGAIENTVKIAERCELNFEFDSYKLPKYPVPLGDTSSGYLRRLAEQGLNTSIAKGRIRLCEDNLGQYKDRIEYELGVIDKMGYSDYFLIVWDYVSFAHKNNIPVGPGRGSGAGSLVAFLIGITDIDPIRYDLIFERFLNPERVSMPDIDVDFCYNRRDEVIRYMYDKYGEDHVSQIIAFGTLGAKAAVRDVGRVMGMPYSEVDVVAKAIPADINVTLSSALKQKTLKSLYDENPKVKQLIDTAMELEGMPRNITIHAAGIVVSDRPLTEYVPLALSNDSIVTQFDMDTVAKIGLLKFDFLALRYLTIIDDTVRAVRESEPSFDIDAIPLDDKKTYALIADGNTDGIFQLESGGMKQMLTELAPDRFDDIIAAIALYRPGPMESIPRYIAMRHDPQQVTYEHPLLEPILSSTYGCIVYQEQVMSIFRVIAGYSYGHADVVRRSISKKKGDALNAERDSFISGALQRGIDKKTAEKLFDDMASFANYAFNKSHAAAYAMISYRTAYLKAHYPCEYMSALITSVLGNMTKLAEYIAACPKLKIRVLPPDINESRLLFHPHNGDIVFGLLAVKNVGRQFIENILQERRLGGRFSDFEDFISRMSQYDMNKRMVESLIKVGAFDGFGIYRSRLLASYEALIEFEQQKNRNNLAGQLDMFSMQTIEPSVSEKTRFVYPDIKEAPVKEKLKMEKEAAGMYFSGNMLDSYSKHISALTVQNISYLLSLQDEKADKMHVSIVGMVTSMVIKNTRGNSKMAFLSVEDKYGEIECILFPNTLHRYSERIKEDLAVYIEGSLTLREDEPPKVIINSLIELIEDYEYKEPSIPPAKAGERQSYASLTTGQTAKVPLHSGKSGEKAASTPQSSKDFATAGRVYIRLPDLSSIKYQKVKNLVDIFVGSTRVFFYDRSTSSYQENEKGIALSKYVYDELVSLAGEENVVLR